MEKNTILYTNQIFVQRKPFDNRKKIYDALIELKTALPLYAGTISGLKELADEGRKPDRDALVAFSLLRSRVRYLEKQASLPVTDSSGCLQFWFLNNAIKPGSMSVPGQEFILSTIGGENIRTFGSAEELFDEFVPLDTILEKGKFKGKKMVNPKPDSVPIYVMYRYKKNLIVCRQYDDYVIITPSICHGDFDLELALYGSVNESLKGDSKLRVKIYKMKNECERQID